MPYGFPRRLEGPSNPAMVFSEVDSPCSCKRDDGNLSLHAPFVPARTNPFLRFIGVFGRVVEYGQITCYQYLYVWNGQFFLPHPMDYQPAFVYIDPTMNEKWVVYDRRHYEIDRHLIAPLENVWMKVNPLWHSFKIVDQDPSIPPLTIEPLTDDYLNHWWGMADSRARLVITDTMKKPSRTRGRRTFRDVSISLREKAIHWIKYPYLYFAYRNETLEDCLRLLHEEIVEPARLILSNPGYLEVSTGFIELLLTLETYGCLELGGSPRDELPDNADTIIGGKERIREVYKDLPETWTLDNLKSTEGGNNYFSQLRIAIKESRYIPGISARLVKQFKEKMAKK